MKIHIPPRVRRLLAVAPAAALGAAAFLAESASAGSNPCFDPTLEIFSTSVPGAATSKGKAGAKLKWKRPFIVDGDGAAEGFLDQDSGAVASISASGTSRFYTPTCEGWSYSWSAKGTVAGVIRAKTSKSWPGSAQAACSFAGCVSGDVNPAAQDSKTATSATTGGASVMLNVGAGSTGPGFGLGISTSAQSVTASSNPAGDVNTLLGGPTTNVGAGSQTLCTVSLYGYITVQALGGGVFGSADAHTSKSTASAVGLVGGVVEQELFARSPAGALMGMGIHAQSGYWRPLKWNGTKQAWDRGPYLPNFGTRFDEEGPNEEESDDPPLPPLPGDREANDGGWRRY